MHFRTLLFVVGIFIAPQLFSSEFPTGNLQGAGFAVQKGNHTFTEKDLYAYSSSAAIVEQPDGRYQITIVANMQKSPTTPAVNDRRVDIYQVIWESLTAGKLINSDDAYKGDKSSFVIANGQLVIKSWIARNQLWETHIYSLAK